MIKAEHNPINEPDSITKKCASLLSAWFAASARDLPWRGEKDPYRILVSEVMLQQTQVSSCIPFYNRFVHEFPTLERLAESPVEKVLAIWQGLGYYSRARNLHKAAREAVIRFQGVLPDSEMQLKTLPGIGDYTAAAVCAIAFNKPSAMVDANIRRVLGRMYALAAEGHGQERKISSRCLALSRSGRPMIVNQALMELGATVCTARNPACGACPVAPFCEAYRRGEYVWYGSSPRRMQKTPKTETCVVATMDGRVLLARPADNRWRGLWEFPRVSFEGEPDAVEASRLFTGIFGIIPAETQYLGLLKHTVTRFDISLRIFRTSIEQCPENPLREILVAEIRDLESIPLPSPMRKVARAFLMPLGLFP